MLLPYVTVARFVSLKSRLRACPYASADYTRRNALSEGFFLAAARFPRVVGHPRALARNSSIHTNSQPNRPQTPTSLHFFAADHQCTDARDGVGLDDSQPDFLRTGKGTENLPDVEAFLPDDIASVLAELRMFRRAEKGVR